jgi:hypothetical protein
MATTTPNFGWAVPTSTDLVKDGAVAIETLGDSIDASLVDLKGGTTGQVLKKATNTDMDFVWSADSAGMTNPMTTTGDTIYSSSGSTPARLGIGTTGQVLTVAGGVPTWAAAGAAATSYTLINTGGTALTGASTITITGLSGYNKLAIYIDGASAGSGAYFDYRFNSDTGNNYGSAGLRIIAQSTYDSASFNTIKHPANYIVFSENSGNTASLAYGIINVDGANSSGRKVINQVGGGNQTGGGVNNRIFVSGGFYSGTSVISSFSFISSDATNFDAGTIYIYGAN